LQTNAHAQHSEMMLQKALQAAGLYIAYAQSHCHTIAFIFFQCKL